MNSSGYCNMFLQELRLEICDSIDELVPGAHYLVVECCNNLISLSILTGTERLDIWDYDNLEILSVASGAQITSLHVCNCEKLKWLPERMQEILPSLNKLGLGNCPEIEFFPEGGLPINLEVLQIINCEKLVNGLKEWNLHRFPVSKS
ncbi:hypothetical protein FXO38_21171 [Capsicum annuum]|uniref:Uncharacterized protein n=1 Tax=Capsicum annuum TaxID=4072 RepID=A0A2G2ZW73_CAPAN|nr:hypothetical protein FXO38_21171 [Capsicum annuum]KAF3662704.1 hypothetical protein FXO37_12322 [Capsicum annuum]PHT86233.1 hypothetical protein T459_08339 [Capsicum annuum]